jgi:hypothetical protein
MGFHIGVSPFYDLNCMGQARHDRGRFLVEILNNSVSGPILISRHSLQEELTQGCQEAADGFYLFAVEARGVRKQWHVPACCL